MILDIMHFWRFSALRADANGAHSVSFFNKRKQRSAQYQENIEKNLKSIWVDPMGPSSTSHPDP